MRICILTTSYPRSGSDDAGIFVKRLVEAYAEAGAAGLVIVPLDSAEPQQEEQAGFLVQRFKYGLWRKGSLAFGAGIVPNLRENPWRLLQAPLMLIGFIWRALAGRKDYEVVHANWLFAGLAAWIISFLTGKPYVITVRGEDMRLLRRKLFRLAFSRPLKQAAAVVSINQRFLAELQKIYGFGKERLIFIPNGVEALELPAGEAAEFALKQGLEPTRPYLLFVGSLIPRKRVEILIEFVARAALKDYVLILCGRTEDQSYFKKLWELAASLGCRERVLFKGQVPPGEIPYYLKLGRFYLSASEFEGRPNAVLEALAAGCLVFASDIPAHRELIKHGETGYLFQAGDLEGLERDFLAAAGDAEKSAEITARAAALAQQFTWIKAAKSYLNLFRTAPGSKNSGVKK